MLPVLARDEESQSTTQESMFNYVRLSDGGEPSVSGDMHSETDILADLAERVIGTERFDWGLLRGHHTLREAIADVVPGYEAIAAIEEAGEFQVSGRTFHLPRFSTSDGRAHFTPVAVPPPAPGYQLMTIRSEGQFNTVVYDEEDLYRGTTRRDVLMLSATDAGDLGVADGDEVEVTSAAGRLRARAAIIDIAAGSMAMYYPEANVLADRRLDPESRTPAFKSVPITVVPV